MCQFKKAQCQQCQKPFFKNTSVAIDNWLFIAFNTHAPQYWSTSSSWSTSLTLPSDTKVKPVTLQSQHLSLSALSLPLSLSCSLLLIMVQGSWQVQTGSDICHLRINQKIAFPWSQCNLYLRLLKNVQECRFIRHTIFFLLFSTFIMMVPELY